MSELTEKELADIFEDHDTCTVEEDCDYARLRVHIEAITEELQQAEAKSEERASVIRRLVFLIGDVWRGELAEEDQAMVATALSEDKVK